jgi:hypothetical protein
VGLQILQQAAGINTVMYFTPAILELAGVHDKRTALLVRPSLSVITGFFQSSPRAPLMPSRKDNCTYH